MEDLSIHKARAYPPVKPTVRPRARAWSGGGDVLLNGSEAFSLQEGETTSPEGFKIIHSPRRNVSTKAFWIQLQVWVMHRSNGTLVSEKVSATLDARRGRLRTVVNVEGKLGKRGGAKATLLYTAHPRTRPPSNREVELARDLRETDSDPLPRNHTSCIAINHCEFAITQLKLIARPRNISYVTPPSRHPELVVLSATGGQDSRGPYFSRFYMDCQRVTRGFRIWRYAQTLERFEKRWVEVEQMRDCGSRL